MTAQERSAPVFRWLLIAVVALSLTPTVALAQAAPCQFILGFKTLHDLDPQDIGNCLDNQAFAANGDAQQHTTNGLMAWRKADNWTAFTNGYWTWINGPYGLAKRLNTVRFTWEANPTGLTEIDNNGNPVPTAPATPAGYTPIAGTAGQTVDWAGFFGGTFHGVVLAAYTAPVIAADSFNSASTAPAGTQFVIWVLQVTNTSQKSADVLDADIDVLDAQGRTFTYTQTPIDASFAAATALNTQTVGSGLGPSLTATFTVVYVVALNSTGVHLVPATNS